jgi:hypothetical protein
MLNIITKSAFESSPNCTPAEGLKSDQPKKEAFFMGKKHNNQGKGKGWMRRFRPAAQGGK